MSDAFDLDFVAFWELFGPAVIAALVAALLCGHLGFFVVTRRVAFVSAALGQISGLGVALGFLVGTFLGTDPHEQTPWWLDPMLMALLLTGVAAMALSSVSRFFRAPPESAVAFAYLSAAALAVIVLASPRMALEKHEIENLLFGNAVAVRHEHLFELVAVAAVVLLTQLAFFKDFLFVGFDREMARSLGLPVNKLELFLHLSIGVSVAVATRACFLVLPAGAALLVSESVRGALALSIIGACLAAGVGFYVSYVGSWPTGPMMVACAALFWPLAGSYRLLKARLRT